MFRSAKAAVNDKGQLLKSKETDAKRQQDVFQRKVRPEGKINIFDEEIIILKVEQNAEVYYDTCKKADSVPYFCLRAVGRHFRQQTA